MMQFNLHKAHRVKPHLGIELALSKFDDSPTKMAQAIGCGVLRQHVEYWRDKSKAVPAEHCKAVNSLTDVPLWDLRPADWFRIWPDLIDKKGAPDVPDLADEKAA